MDVQKYNNALNEFFRITSSLEYSVKGYCDFEVVSLIEKIEKAPIVQPKILSVVEERIEREEKKESKFIPSVKDKPITMTPSILKKEFFYCKKCSISSDKRVLSEGDLLTSIVFVLTDEILKERERLYLDKVLSSIHLEVGKNAYLTSLLKCESDKSANENDYNVCSEFVKHQASLTPSRAFIAFGKRASSFLKSLKKDESFTLCAFVYASSLSDIEKNNDLKKKLWGSFKKLVPFLNLPRV